MTGEGVYTWDNGDVATGTFSNGLREGKNVFVFAQGGTSQCYDGLWKDDLPHGRGWLEMTNGDT